MLFTRFSRLSRWEMLDAERARPVSLLVCPLAQRLSSLFPPGVCTDIRTHYIARLVTPALLMSTLIWLPWIQRPRVMLRALSAIYLPDGIGTESAWSILWSAMGIDAWISKAGTKYVRDSPLQSLS
jgi:hypothetical protein